MPVSNLSGDAEDALQRIPSTRRAHKTSVLHLRPRVERVPVRLGLMQPAIREKPSGQRAKREDRDAFQLAVRRHRPGRPLIEQRIANLVTDNRNAAFHQQLKMRGVHVRHAEMTNQPFLPELVEIEHGIQPARMRIRPRVKLQQVNARHTHAHARPMDGGSHLLARDGAGLRHPLREQLHPGNTGARSKMTDNILRRPVVIGHIKSGKTGDGVGHQRVGSLVERKGLPVTLKIRHLPEPRHDTRDRQVGRERIACRGQRHTRCVNEDMRHYSGGSVENRCASETPDRRSPATSRA